MSDLAESSQPSEPTQRDPLSSEEVRRHSYLWSGNDTELPGRVDVEPWEVLEVPAVLRRELECVPGEVVPLSATSLGENAAVEAAVREEDVHRKRIIAVFGNSATVVSLGLIRRYEPARLPRDLDEEAERGPTSPQQLARVELDIFAVANVLSTQREQRGGAIVLTCTCRIRKTKPLRTPRDAFLCRRGVFPSQRPTDTFAVDTATPLTPFPAFAYRMYDENALAVVARRIAMERLLHLPADIPIPEDPEELSFWLIGNLLHSRETIRKLLDQDTVTKRLRQAISCLKRSRKIFCVNCGCRFGSSADMFVSSDAGLVAAYSNPGGYIHEIVTLRQLQSYRHDDEPPSEEHSWFPGYAWTILYCAICSQHIGWRFTSPHRDPSAFFAVRRGAVSHSRRNAPIRDERQRFVLALIRGMRFGSTAAARALVSELGQTANRQQRGEDQRPNSFSSDSSSDDEDDRGVDDDEEGQGNRLDEGEDRAISEDSDEAPSTETMQDESAERLTLLFQRRRRNQHRASVFSDWSEITDGASTRLEEDGEGDIPSDIDSVVEDIPPHEWDEP